MFMELIVKDELRTINTDHITIICHDGDGVGIKMLDYKPIIHLDMSYKEFMEQFRMINALNVHLRKDDFK